MMGDNASTGLDLSAIRALLAYGVVGTCEYDVGGATVDDVADAAYDLLAEVERLREDNVALRRAWRVDSDGQHETNVRLADERDRLREDNRLMQQVIDDAHGELDYLAPGTNGLEHDLIERLVSIRER